MNTHRIYSCKQCVCDGKSGNLWHDQYDYRSLYLHFENGAFLYNCDAVKEMRKDFEHIFAEYGSEKNIRAGDPLFCVETVPSAVVCTFDVKTHFLLFMTIECFAECAFYCMKSSQKFK